MAKNDFVAFDSVSGNDSHGMLLLADHARNAVPPEYDNLGIDDGQFLRHIAYDIGVEMVTRALAELLDVPAVMSGFSRLLIDPNRGLDDPTLIMRISDGAIIPANHPMTETEAQKRIASYHQPYHREIDVALDRIERASGKAPLVISIHSFTEAWKGVPRPWEIGILWDSDARAVHPMIEALRRDPNLTVGDNEPYDGALKGDTMYQHCTQRGFAHALIELRQDLIATLDGASEWANRLAPILDEINQRPDVHVMKKFGSRAR